MDVNMIVSKINAGLSDEGRTGRYAQMVRNMGEANGQRKVLGDRKFEAAVGEVVTWTTEYIRRVPEILQEMSTAAESAGVLHDLTPFMVAVEKYWREQIDVIPDHMGLVGVLDDAYYSLWMTQRFSEDYQSKVGKPLLSNDLSIANSAARQLIGEPFSTQIEQGVRTQLNLPAVTQVLTALLKFNSTFNTPDPIWGNASVDDIVKTRMGAMGIF